MGGFETLPLVDAYASQPEAVDRACGNTPE